MRVGTRASKLARLQTQIVVDNLQKHFPNEAIEIVLVTTGGDKVVDRPIAELGFRGVFVKELEESLVAGEVDLVVHSLKDMPTDVPQGLAIAAVLEREDPRDVLVCLDKIPFIELKQNAIVATSSRRRAAQLSGLRPDINFIDIRGNIETRLRKLKENHCDATLLAHAGLLRLGLLDFVAEVFEVSILTPAAGQGALAIECRIEDKSKLSVLDNPDVRRETDCERMFLSELGGGCSVPIGASAQVRGSQISITGCIAALDGGMVFRKTISGDKSKSIGLGKELADLMMQTEACKVVEGLRLTVPNRISPP